MPRRSIAVIDAPSDLGLAASGVAGLPDALRAAGLLDGIAGVHPAGSIPVPARSGIRDPASGILDGDAIGAFALLLADRVGEALDNGAFPLVLGGDCSILLGPALALRRRGRSGLIFLDGHADLYDPASEPAGEGASMELALVTGRGPAALADLEGRGPLFRDADVVVFGCRDAEDAAAHGSPDVRATGMTVLDLAEVGRAGAAAAARVGVAAVEAVDADGYWIHLDADVLHDDAMPAVGYRLPGGLRPTELTDALAVLLASPLVVGMEITIYDPSLDDAERTAGRTLAAAVTAAFRRAW